MKIRATIAEYAVGNADGTYTIVRGGLEFWIAPQLALTLALFLFIEIDPGVLKEGPHTLLIRVTGVDGLKLIEGNVELLVVASERPTRVAAFIQANIQRYGPIAYEASVGGLAASRILDIRPPEKA